LNLAVIGGMQIRDWVRQPFLGVREGLAREIGKIRYLVAVSSTVDFCRIRAPVFGDVPSLSSVASISRLLLAYEIHRLQLMLTAIFSRTGEAASSATV
jgi:hypothetical protein